MGLKLTRDFGWKKEVDFEILDRSENCLCAVEQIEGKGEDTQGSATLRLRSLVSKIYKTSEINVF